MHREYPIRLPRYLPTYLLVARIHTYVCTCVDNVSPYLDTAICRQDCYVHNEIQAMVALTVALTMMNEW